MTENANSQRCFPAAVWMNSVLILSWLCGLLLGYSLYEPLFFPLMRSLFLQPVSIVGLVICILLPLVLTAIFYLIEKPIFISIVCFIKAAAFGFSCSVISREFASASWLVQFLFLFSDCCFLTILMSLWLSCSDSPKRKRLKAFRIAAVFGIFIALIDYLLVSPLLERLF